MVCLDGIAGIAGIVVGEFVGGLFAWVRLYSGLYRTTAVSLIAYLLYLAWLALVDSTGESDFWR